VGPCIWASKRTLLCGVRSSAGVLDGIYRIDSRDERRPIRLTVTPYPPVTTSAVVTSPAMCPLTAGTSYTYVRSRFRHQNDPAAPRSGALFVADIDGTNVHRITQWGLPNSPDIGFESRGSRHRGIIFGTEGWRACEDWPRERRLRRLSLDIPPDPYAYDPR
jgi:hypothetical protein